jgi:hypothetical protein
MRMKVVLASRRASVVELQTTVPYSAREPTARFMGQSTTMPIFHWFGTLRPVRAY